MNRAKRLLALLLVLATVLSIFPLQSLAAEVEEVSQEPEAAETAELHAEEEPEEPSGDEAEVPAEEKPENFAEDQVETPIEKESEPEEGPADSSAPARQPARISSGAEVVADGISGDVSWTLYDDGTLVIGETITGSGKMADYPRSNARPWWRINNVVYLQQITSVIVKEGVTSIGDYAFFYMQKLTNLELPDSITSIGDSAFGTCRSLTSVVIPDAVTSIGNDAFNFAENLTDVVIPTSLTNIGKDAFANTAWQKNQGDFPVVNGILIGYEGEGGVVTIPENVTAINTGAFAWCSSSYGNSNVTEIIIPDTVKSIGTDAFCYCTNLTTAVLSGSVTAIPERMFQSCVSLTSVTIPEGVTSIEKSAFECCCSLTRIDLPDGVTTIGNDAFSWCESLTQITIPASVTKIGGDAFDSVSTDLVIIGDVDSYAQQFATDRGFQFRCYMPLGSVELSKTVYTYSGAPCTPKVTVRDMEGNLLEEDVDFTVTYSDNIDVGTATATVTGIGLYLGTITATYSIQPAAQALVVTPSAVTVGMGETVQLNVTGFGTLHFSINQPNVATVGANGLVKGLTVGSAVITVKADGDRNHRAAATTVPVTVVLATPQITGVISQNNGVQISWNAVPGAAKYRVFHKTGTGNWQGLGITTGLTFTDTTAVSGVKYDYTVRCVSADEKTYTSSFDPVGKTITYIATPVLAEPENVAGGVQVTWGKVDGAAKYRLYRKNSSGGWTSVGDTTGLSLVDTKVPRGSEQTYTVRCVSSDGKTHTSSFDPVGKSIFVPLYTAPNSYSFSVAYRTGVYYNRLMSVKVGSDQRQAILDVAQSQLGYTEGNNKNAIGGNASGSQNYTEFGLWYYNNIDSSDQFYLGAWCSMFVSWCANEAGIPADVIPRRALVAYMKDAFEKMGRYYAWTKSKCGGGKQDIRPGDLILFSTAPLGRLNHIGLVQNVTYKNGQVTIKTVEGNKGDQCCMKTYTLSTSSLTGYVTNEKVYIRGFACPAYNN